MAIRKHWKIVAGLVMMFALGFGTGAVVTVGVIQRSFQKKQDATTWTPRTLDWLRSDVGITPQQAETLRPVVQRSMDDMAAFRDRAEHERRAIYARLLADVAEHLDDAQRQRLKQVVERAIAADPSFSRGS